jgi:hypothetical protein
VLTPDKRSKYERVIRKRNGKPLLYLFARTPKAQVRFSNGGKHIDIGKLEKLLISIALSQNPELINVCETKFYRSLSISGIFNAFPGRPRSSAVEIKKALAW